MPNFWSKSGQFISEKIYGTRTKDEDFNKVCEKMKSTEKGLSHLKSVIQNFATFSEHFKKYINEFNSALKLIYDNSPFGSLIEGITFNYLAIQAELDETNKGMNNLFSKTSEWSIIFNTAKEQIVSREEKRKVYDHYEGKLSKMNKNNNKKDLKYIERNEAKFSKAASEYVEISEKAFNTINNSLKIAYELTNPIINEMILMEKTLFENLGISLSCCDNFLERFKLIKNNFDNPNVNIENITYDPIKFMNEKNLMKKMSIRRKMRTSMHYSFGKKLANQNLGDLKKLNYRNMSMSLKLISENNEYFGIENYKNIYINSRTTNSFGEVSKEILDEFYKIKDDF